MPSVVDAFLRDLETAPQPHVVRLILADYLEEHGDVWGAQCQRWLAGRKGGPYRSRSPEYQHPTCLCWASLTRLLRMVSISIYERNALPTSVFVLLPPTGSFNGPPGNIYALPIEEALWWGYIDNYLEVERAALWAWRLAGPQALAQGEKVHASKCV